MARIGGNVDISARVSGAEAALEDLGMVGVINPDIKDLDKTRLGTKTEKPPTIKTQPSHHYTTSGATTNPKVATDITAPNYGKASSKATDCDSCKSYNKQDPLMGHCEKYDFYARADYTCDGWTPKKRRAPTQIIRMKLRDT